jgi:hypothetical protein
VTNVKGWKVLGRGRRFLSWVDSWPTEGFLLAAMLFFCAVGLAYYAILTVVVWP